MKKKTIEDVAKLAGVSKGTVSAVINAKTSVKPTTRDAVLAVMKKLNFRPQGVARNLKSRIYEKSIGLIIKDLNYPFYTSIASGVKEYANDKGYIVVITSSENKHESEKEISNLFASKDIKGAIIAPIIEGTSEIEHLFKLKMINYPFVLLENVQGIQSNVVTIDNIIAIKKAVKYLIDIGHKKIVHFAGPENSSHTQERIEGFISAFSEQTLAYNKKMLIHIGSTFEESLENTKNYFSKLKKSEYPTAIVCFNDGQALGVMSALKELNIKVPDDISIIGNDDIFYAQIYPVPLTTIRAPQREIGRKAAEILIKNIESKELLEPETFVLDTELIKRESTKNCK